MSGGWGSWAGAAAAGSCGLAEIDLGGINGPGLLEASQRPPVHAEAQGRAKPHAGRAHPGPSGGHAGGRGLIWKVGSPSGGYGRNTNQTAGVLTMLAHESRTWNGTS